MKIFIITQLNLQIKNKLKYLLSMKLSFIDNFKTKLEKIDKINIDNNNNN